MRGRLRRPALAAAAFALLGQSAPQPRPGDPTSLAFDALRRGAYLEAVDRARAAAFDASGQPAEPAFSTWSQIHPFIGGATDTSAAGRYGPSAPFSKERLSRMRRSQPRDAIAEIVERARRTRIVILNEAHNSPRDRAFALEVARALRPLGYTILAAETFANYPDRRTGSPIAEAIAREGYVRLESGHYTADPVFADFVREALALGYRPVAYESIVRRPGEPVPLQIARREQNQAKNLMNRIFRRDPNARALIFVGYSHVTESPIRAYGAHIEWMATRLKRMSGVDPLTIDQTAIDETRSDGRRYQEALAGRITRPSLLFLGGAPLVEGQYRGAVDLQVVHPPLGLVRGRPDWLARIGRRPVDIPRHLLPVSGRRLVQAFVAEEPADAIPLDQVIVEAGRRAVPLMLPPGRSIRWAIQDPVPISQPAR